MKQLLPSPTYSTINSPTLISSSATIPEPHFSVYKQYIATQYVKYGHYERNESDYMNSNNLARIWAHIYPVQKNKVEVLGW